MNIKINFIVLSDFTVFQAWINKVSSVNPESGFLMLGNIHYR